MKIAFTKENELVKWNFAFEIQSFEFDFGRETLPAYESGEKLLGTLRLSVGRSSLLPIDGDDRLCPLKSKSVD